MQDRDGYKSSDSMDEEVLRQLAQDLWDFSRISDFAQDIVELELDDRLGRAQDIFPVFWVR